MNITRHNCESIFLDYYEKKLSPVEVAEVFFFLEENPDRREAFEEYKEVFLEHEKINFPGKKALKKKSRLGEAPSLGGYNGEEKDVILDSVINANNCNQFFVAYAEGILSEGQIEKINAFLVQNPKLKKNFEFFQKCKLLSEEIAFENKESLKKEIITGRNKEEYFIRSMENDLNLFEQKALNQFLIKHPQYKKEFELFNRAVLPVENISFHAKVSLKKKERTPIFVSFFPRHRTYYAAAATILLLAGLFYFFRNDNNHQTYIADKTNSANKIMANVKKITVENPVKEKEQKGVSQINKSNNIDYVLVKATPVSNKPKSKKKEVKRQPAIFKEKDNLVVEKEQGKTPIMKKEERATVFFAERRSPYILPDSSTTAEKKEEKKDEINTSQVGVSSVSRESNDEYQTPGSFARNKIRSVLKIKQTIKCEASGKITMWDLAMAAKTGAQKITGTRAVDVNKICDGTRKKIEYVFTAGNFEISKSVSK